MTITNRIINTIQKIRTRNNKCWMQLVRIAFKYAPKQSAKVMKQISKNDTLVTQQVHKLCAGVKKIYKKGLKK